MAKKKEYGESLSDNILRNEASLKEYWDYTSTLDTAYMKGEKKGREEGQQQEKEETVRRLQQMGLTLEQIAQGTGLKVEEVKSILTQNS